VPVGGNFEANDSRVLGDATYAGLGLACVHLASVGRPSKKVGSKEYCPVTGFNHSTSMR
jgi:hypothetical protein